MPPSELAERQTERSFRPELQGLRAFAVLAAVMYHAGLTGLPGGYLGVDVFFVLSGYLISSMIIPKLYAGTFKPAEFLSGRIRRIAPAALVTIVVVLSIGPYTLFAWQTEELGISALLSVLGMANLWFSTSVGYFFPDADNHMLLHFWSLSVEMQFYLLIPLFFLALIYAGVPHKYLAVTMGAAFIIATLCSFWISTTYPQGAFFYTSARLYEFAAGGALAAFVLRAGRIKGMPANLATTLGVCILIAAFEFTPLAHTGPLASFPIIVGTLLILLSEPAKGIGYKLLTHKLALRIGACSYSLYLIHQPILVWLRQFNGSIGAVGTMGALVVAYLLAEISYHYVENKLRKVDSSPKWTAILGGSAMAIVAGLAIQTSLAAPMVSAVVPQDEDLAVSVRDRAFYLKEDHAYFEGRGFPSADGRKRLLLIGDSHSQDMTNMLIEGGFTATYQISTHYVPYYCQFAFFEGAGDHVPSKHRGLCRDRQQFLPSAETVSEADIILVAARWEPWAAKRASESLAEALGRPQAPVIVTGPKIFRDMSDEKLRLQRLLGMSLEQRKSMALNIPARTMEADGALRADLQDTPYLYQSSLSVFCDMRARSCPVFTNEGYLISYDGIHLTKQGAKWAADRLLKPILTSGGTLPY